jgi:phage terminase large subunit-like protein
MRYSPIPPQILAYMEAVENGQIPACREQFALMKHLRCCWDTEEIYTDVQQLERYLSLVKYFPFDRLYPWEEFILALHLCTYRADGLPRWPDLFCMLGRGAGKDGVIAFQSFCLLSPYNGIDHYDVDICANNEDQAMRPLKDVLEVLDDPKNQRKLRKNFAWTKEEITGRKTRSVMKGRTNSPKGKDGLRSGICIFNEIHQYPDYKNINVFTTGLGKKPHPRRSFYTTNGDVREGPLDDMLRDAEDILFHDQPDGGMLPFICRLDSKADVDDPAKWPMANPSLPYNPTLQEEIRKEYGIWKRNPAQLPAFMTKRMNLPQSDPELAVTDWDNIAATNRPLPDLSGWECIVGIDFASLRDWAAVNFHFRKGDLRYDFGHYWLCLQSPELGRVKAPWRQWAEAGWITPVDDVEISPDLLTDYIARLGAQYAIRLVALDNYRFALVKRSLEGIGFRSDLKNIRLVRPSDIMRVQPVIASCFNHQFFVWGDNPPLRWATNNTKLVRSGKAQGTDTGNYYYAKIEGKSRKTDPFMALVACMVAEDEVLSGVDWTALPDLGVITA